MITRIINKERTKDGLLKQGFANVESQVVEKADYRGFTIEVHELTEGKSRFRFMPLILQDGRVVRRIFVRSKSAYVSLNHFAKRAVDHFLKTGDWPSKQGTTVK